MKTLTIISLTATSDEATTVARALQPFPCALHSVTEFQPQENLNTFSQGHIDLLIVAGPIGSVRLAQFLDTVRTTFPKALLVLALKDMAQSTLLAVKYNGLPFPWPFDAEVIRPILFRAQTEALSFHRRQEARLRILVPASIITNGEALPALLVNLSEGGAMVLADSTSAAGDPIHFELTYGIDKYQLSGRVRHRGHSAELKAELERDSFLLENRESIVGMEFDAPSTAVAARLREALKLERRLKRLRVLCIPMLHPLVESELLRLGIEIEKAPHVPNSLPHPPALLLIGLNAIAAADLEKLTALSRRTVIIGILDGPLDTTLPAELVTTFSAVFRLPFHNELLVQHMRDFLSPVERQFPRIEEPFKATLTLPNGTKLEADGNDYSFEGCGLTSPQKLAENTPVSGLLFLSQAIRPYAFDGLVVYCTRGEDGYNIGIQLRVQEAHQTGYQTYLNLAFIRQLQGSWRDRLRHIPL